MRSKMGDAWLRVRRAFSVALLLALATACAAGVDPGASPAPALPEPAPLRPPLSPSEIDAVAMLLRLEDRREFDEELMTLAARSPVSAIREQSALALGRAEGRASRPLLHELLFDPDSAVVASAAFMLGKLRDSTAVPALEALLDPHAAAVWPAVALEAADALGAIGTPAAREALSNFLFEAAIAGSAPTGDAPPVEAVPGFPAGEVVAAAILGAWRAGETDLDTFIRWTTSPDPELRWRAAYALMRLQDPNAVSVLSPMLGDPSELVRAFAARGLAATVTANAPEGRSASRDTLLALAANDSSYHVRIAALRVLGGYPDPAVARFLVASLADPEPHAVVVAIESLSRADPGSAPFVIPALREIAHRFDAPEYLRSLAVDAVGAIDPEGAAPWLESLAGDGSWRVRSAVARASARRRLDGVPLLEALARDLDPRVAVATLDALLSTLGPTRVETIRGLLLELIQSQDAHVRAATLRGFGLLGDPVTYPMLLDAYDRARFDRDNDAMLAAIDAMAALRARAPGALAPERAFFARFPRSEDFLVRRKVAEIFPVAAGEAWGDPGPIDTFSFDSRYRMLAEQWLSDPAPLRRRPRVVIDTELGPIEAVLFSDRAPNTVANFLDLAAGGFYDGREWVRVVADFVVQGGDPRGDTSGGPGYTIRDEVNRARFVRGSLGMALAGPDTGGSQFFITHSPQPHLDGIYTVFGEVTGGMEIVERILPGNRVLSIREITEDS